MTSKQTNFMSYLATVELDIQYHGNSTSLTKYLEIIGENQALQGYNVSDLALLRGIILMVMAGSTGHKEGRSATLHFNKSDRVKLNWPEFMLNQGNLDYLLGGRETIGSDTLRYRISFTGKPSAKSGILFHEFLGYEERKCLKDVMEQNNVKYSKRTGELKPIL